LVSYTNIFFYFWINFCSISFYRLLN